MKRLRPSDTKKPFKRIRDAFSRVRDKFSRKPPDPEPEEEEPQAPANKVAPSERRMMRRRFKRMRREHYHRQKGDGARQRSGETRKMGGVLYEYDTNGSLLRLQPKPWRNRAEQRRYKRAKQLSRQAQQHNQKGTSNDSTKKIH